MYGSSRLGSSTQWTYVSSFTPHTDTNRFARVLGKKRYELTNHLGNVLATISDQKKPVDDGNGQVAYWNPKVVSYSDYMPFGSQMIGRNGNTSETRYGFNGMEKDDEVKGGGNSLDFGARIYDSRVGRFLIVDPKAKEFPEVSNYSFADNSPIFYIDRLGKYKYPANKKNEYPMITRYLSHYVEKDVLNNQAIVQAYKEINPNLTDEHLENDLKWEGKYSITIEFTESFGEWPQENSVAAGEYIRETRTIKINSRYAAYVEEVLGSDARDEVKMVVFARFYKTLLHEQAHANSRFGPSHNPYHSSDYTIEDGEVFDKKIWGELPDASGEPVQDVRSNGYYEGQMEQAIENVNSAGTDVLPTVPETETEDESDTE